MRADGRTVAPLREAYAAVIFDLDGVIVDSEPLHEAAFHAVFAELGHAEDHGIDFTAYYGSTDRAVWNDFLVRFPQSEPLEALAERKQRRFLDLLRDRRPVFPDVAQLVERLAPHTALAVASGSGHPVIAEALSLADLRRYFRAVVSSEDVPHGKPEPDIFLYAARQLGVVPADCCVIEDSPAGVTAARAAGMDVIALTHSVAAARLAHASCVVGSHREVAALLLDR